MSKGGLLDHIITQISRPCIARQVRCLVFRFMRILSGKKWRRTGGHTNKSPLSSSAMYFNCKASCLTLHSAEYFGHKVHIDQNEKMAMYGITVCP